MTPQIRRTIAASLFGLVLTVAGSTSAAEPGAPLSAADRQDIARIEAYLGSFETLQARFLQTTSDGRIAGGMVYMDRPGKMRMTYDSPVEVEVIATGSLLVYHDKDRRQVSQVPLAATPAAVLLADNPKLSGDVTVTGVERVGGAIKITLIQTGHSEEGSLMLGFSDKPLMLRRVVLRDAEGGEVRVSLMEHQVGASVDSGLFEFIDPYNAGGRD